MNDEWWIMTFKLTGVSQYVEWLKVILMLYLESAWSLARSLKATLLKYTPCTGLQIEDIWCQRHKMASWLFGMHILPTKSTLFRFALLGSWLVLTPQVETTWHVVASTIFAQYTIFRPVKVLLVSPGSSRATLAISPAADLSMIVVYWPHRVIWPVCSGMLRLGPRWPSLPTI